jgi:hypothetical protein
MKNVIQLDGTAGSNSLCHKEGPSDASEMLFRAFIDW